MVLSREREARNNLSWMAKNMGARERNNIGNARSRGRTWTIECGNHAPSYAASNAGRASRTHHVDNETLLEFN